MEGGMTGKIKFLKGGTIAAWNAAGEMETFAATRLAAAQRFAGLQVTAADVPDGPVYGGNFHGRGMGTGDGPRD
jgi:hypothetical protein